MTEGTVVLVIVLFVLLGYSLLLVLWLDVHWVVYIITRYVLLSI